MFNPSVAPELKRSAEARARGGRKSPRRSSASGRTKSSGLPGTPNHEPKRTDKRNYSYAPPPGKRQTGFCRRRFEKILPSFQFYIITKRPLAAATASILHKTPRMICCFFFSSNARFKRKWQSLFGADCRLNQYVAYCKKKSFSQSTSAVKRVSSFFFRKPLDCWIKSSACAPLPQWRSLCRCLSLGACYYIGK